MVERRIEAGRAAFSHVLSLAWKPEDFALAPEPAPRLHDPWTPWDGERDPADTGSASVLEIAPTLSVCAAATNEWPDTGLLEDENVAVATDDMPSDLPGFQPGLRQTGFSDVALIPRRTTLNRLKAHLVADQLDIVRDRDLKRVLDVLEDYFSQHGDGATFRAVADVAARHPEPKPFLDALELKQFWAESPFLWGYRGSARGGVAFGEPGRAAMSFRRAAILARFRRDWTADEMIDGAWLEEWPDATAIRPGDRVPFGFWSFAEYAEHRAADEWTRSQGEAACSRGPSAPAEADAGSTFARFRSDLIWTDQGSTTLTLRLPPEGWRGMAPRHAGRSASYVGRRVPALLLKRYAAWREKTFGPDDTP